VDEANLEAISREIAAARRLAVGQGLLAINVMRAVTAYAASVKRALEAGIDAVVVGAGLPLDLPDLAQDHPKTRSSPSSVMRGACNSSSRSGSAKGDCPTPSSSSTPAWPVATWAQRALPTCRTPVSTLKTSSPNRAPSCAAPASRPKCP
jgi:hypothetical protein